MKKIYKIISLVFAILFILISPIGFYYNSRQSVAYAFDDILKNDVSNYLFPIVAFLTVQQMEFNGINDLDADVVAQKIDNMRVNLSAYYNRISSSSKALLAKMYTELSNFEINKMLGLNYTDSQFQQLEDKVFYFHEKMSLNQALSNRDLYELGILDMLALSLKNSTGTSTSMANVSYTPTTISGVDYFDVVSSDGIVFRFNDKPMDLEFYKFIGASLLFSQVVPSYSLRRTLPQISYKLTMATGYSLQFDTLVGASSLFYMYYGNSPVYLSKQYLSFASTVSAKYLNFNIVNQLGQTVDTYRILLREGNENYFTMPDRLRDFLEFIQPYCDVDLINSKYYVNENGLYNIYDLFLFGQLGNINILNTSAVTGAYPLSGLNTSLVFTAADTSLTAAELVIGNTATDTTYDNNIESEDDDIIIIPGDTSIPDVSTGTDVDVPDTGGAFEDGGIFNIPILGSIWQLLKNILDWLKNFWNNLLGFLSTIITLLTNIFNTLSEGNSVDWGNFKGFFDIFYIFYYLIILAIIMLIKFFGVIVSILDIPANTALFDQYPTMLAGLNYLKNLKIGGFNITLQQIFEYMFTIFFFLYIVTTLQKLYHSFTTIERQSIREMEQQEAKIYREENK